MIRLLVLLFFAAAGLGQHLPGPKVDPDPRDRGLSSDEEPAHGLNFESQGVVKGVTATPILTIPFKCTSSSDTFLDMRDPKKIAEALVFVIHGDAGKRIALTSAIELRDIEVIDYYPTSSSVAFLVWAAKADQSNGGDRESRAGRANHRRYYIVSTDHDGQHERSIELPMTYPLFRLAALESGEYLLSGYDLPEQTLRLLLLDHGGRVIQSIDQPRKVIDRQRKTDSELNSIDGSNELEAGRTLFVSYKENVLVWRRGTSDPVLDVRAGGVVREVRLALPPGQRIADIVPSNTWWLVHTESDTASDNEAHDLSANYLEVSPLDGSIVRRLKVSGLMPTVIACEDQTVYRAFSTDATGKLFEFTAH